MWLGEELRRLGGNTQVLVDERRHPHCQHRFVRHSRLLWVKALQPDPGDALEFVLVPNRERKSFLRLLGSRKRKTDSPHV